MPRQSRRKTLSPSSATTFLSETNLDCSYDPLALPDPPSSCGARKAAESKVLPSPSNDENCPSSINFDDDDCQSDSGAAARAETPEESARSPGRDAAEFEAAETIPPSAVGASAEIDKVDADVESLISANASCSPCGSPSRAALSPLADEGGSEAMLCSPAPRAARRSKRKKIKKRQSICLPSQNPDLADFLNDSREGVVCGDGGDDAGACLDPKCEESAPVSVSSGMIDAAIEKFSDLDDSELFTPMAAELAEFITLHTNYPILSKRQIELGKMGDDGKASVQPTLQEKQKVSKKIQGAAAPVAFCEVIPNPRIIALGPDGISAVLQDHGRREEKGR